MPLHTIFSTEGCITVKAFHSMLLCFKAFDMTVVISIMEDGNSALGTDMFSNERLVTVETFH